MTDVPLSKKKKKYLLKPAHENNSLWKKKLKKL